MASASWRTSTVTSSIFLFQVASVKKKKSTLLLYTQILALASASNLSYLFIASAPNLTTLTCSLSLLAPLHQHVKKKIEGFPKLRTNSFSPESPCDSQYFTDTNIDIWYAAAKFHWQSTMSYFPFMYQSPHDWLMLPPHSTPTAHQGTSRMSWALFSPPLLTPPFITLLIAVCSSVLSHTIIHCFLSSSWYIPPFLSYWLRVVN